MPEVALLFLLLGAVVCHHLEDLLLQVGESPERLEPWTWLGSLAHYLQLGLVEAGQVLPTAARTVEYFVRQLPGQEQADMQWLHEVEQRLPSVSFAPDVVAFLQGICIILAALFSLSAVFDEEEQKAWEEEEQKAWAAWEEQKALENQKAWEEEQKAWAAWDKVWEEEQKAWAAWDNAWEEESEQQQAKDKVEQNQPEDNPDPEKAPYIWIHQLVMLAFSWELWLLLA
eukprot:g26989.t1